MAAGMRQNQNGNIFRFQARILTAMKKIRMEKFT